MAIGSATAASRRDRGNRYRKYWGVAIYTLTIRNATITDGTGNTRYQGDVAVDGNKITAVQLAGTLAPGNENIDASGLVVTPGFVDIHTHYDGQVRWYKEVTPNSWHGVTTVVMGNCGVGFPI